MSLLNNKIHTIFMGTPEFSIPTLEAIIKSDFIEVIAVVCNPDKPVGRDKTLTPPPTKILAQKHNIPVLQPDKIRKPEWVEKIKEINPELIIVAAFGQIIPRDILDIPKYKSINIHGSLLPKLRGASPVQYAILEGHKITGPTIMIMDELMDHGPLLAQREIPIDAKETSATLFEKMSLAGADLLIATLPDWIAGKITPQEQNHENATPTKIIKKENGKIDWSRSAEQIERQIRAFNPWPGSFCFYKNNDKIIKISIIEAELPNHTEIEKKSIGEIFADNGNLVIQTGDGALKINKIQPEGKKSMDAKSFINGYANILNTILS